MSSIFLMLFIPTEVLCQTLIDYKIEGNLYCGRIKVSNESSHIGYIDSLGQLVIPCQYLKDSYPSQISSDFYEGFSTVRCQDQSCKWIDVAGKCNNCTNYRYCSAFYSGVAWCADKNRKTNRIYDAVLINDSIHTFPRGDKKYISNRVYYRKTEVVPIKHNLYKNLIQCKLYTLADSLIGVFVLKESSLSSFGFIDVFDCNRNKWGLIDQKGTLVVDYQSDRMIFIYEGNFLISKGGTQQVFNMKTGKLYEKKYKSYDVNNQFLICLDTNGTYDVFCKGELLFKDLSTYPQVGCIKDEKTQKYGFIDETGNVIEGVYDNYINYNEEGYALVRREGKAKIINRKGCEIIGER